MDSRALALALMAGFAFSGCSGSEADESTLEASTLLLRFTLVKLSDSSQGASPGGHCGTAFLRDGAVHVAAKRAADVESPYPLLIVLPTLEGTWATTGSSPYWSKLPRTVSTGISGEPQKVGAIAWDPELGARPTSVDGRNVELPYMWTVQDDQGEWRMEAALEAGPSRVTLYEPQPCR